MSNQASNPMRSSLSRRQMLKLMGGAASLVALAACQPVGACPSGRRQPVAMPQAPAKVGGKLNVVHRREYFKEMETIFEDAVKKWGAENNVEMEVSAVASEAFEDFVAKLVAQVQARRTTRSGLSCASGATTLLAGCARTSHRCCRKSRGLVWQGTAVNALRT